MKYYSSQSGFSLVEVLVAISILLLVIVGPMGIISRANNSTAYSTEQVTAFFLAQEGLELAQKARDDRMLGDFDDQIRSRTAYPNPWEDSTQAGEFMETYATCFLSTGCGLYVQDNDAAAPLVVNCSTPTNCLIVQNAASNVRNKLTYPAAVPTVEDRITTPYTRIITMVRTPASGQVQEIRVTSTVTWRTGSLVAGQQVQLGTYLMNNYDTQ
jgi:prepilin-type N-terminal cleavage/methylation domain-containing protein